MYPCWQFYRLSLFSIDLDKLDVLTLLCNICLVSICPFVLAFSFVWRPIRKEYELAICSSFFPVAFHFDISLATGF